MTTKFLSLAMINARVQLPYPAIVYREQVRRECVAKPPKSGPHSDIDGVFSDARAGVPSRDPKKGSAAELDRAEQESAGRPEPSKDKG